MYANYEYYQNEYHGSAVPPAEFDYYAGLAGDYIDHATVGRATSEQTQVKRCACRIAELLYQNKAAASGNQADAQKTSEKVGDYSVSYAVQPLTAEQLDAKIKGEIYRYLARTGLLYRGL